MAKYFLTKFNIKILIELFLLFYVEKIKNNNISIYNRFLLSTVNLFYEGFSKQ